ncbi:unnamed protein product, partial [Rotaria socialis]
MSSIVKTGSVSNQVEELFMFSTVIGEEGSTDTLSSVDRRSDLVVEDGVQTAGLHAPQEPIHSSAMSAVDAVSSAPEGSHSSSDAVTLTNHDSLNETSNMMEESVSAVPSAVGKRARTPSFKGEQYQRDREKGGKTQDVMMDDSQPGSPNESTDSSVAYEPATNTARMPIATQAHRIAASLTGMDFSQPSLDWSNVNCLGASEGHRLAAPVAASDSDSIWSRSPLSTRSSAPISPRPIAAMSLSKTRARRSSLAITLS